MKIRTRYAPSPTGFFHIGGARTALFNYLYAKHNNGDFILRIEDTDLERNVKGGIESQITNLEWMGLMADESIKHPGSYGPYIQTQKLNRYQQLAKQLVKENKAYYCFCSKEELLKNRIDAKEKNSTPKYNRHCLSLSKQEIAQKLAMNIPYTIRLKIPDNAIISWTDLIRGEISVPTSALTDPVILKSNGFPMYNFAVVVDDYDMQISHVIRGEEHISNTPYQIAIKNALWPEKDLIKYGHLSIIVDEHGKKLSKRNPTIKQFIQDYQEMGFLPQAINNFLVLLGWFPKNNKEIMSLAEMISSFEINNLSKAPTFFDYKKLLWISNKYFNKITDQQYLDFVQKFVTIDFKQYQPIRNEILLLFKKQINYAKQLNELIDNLFFNYHFEKIKEIDFFSNQKWRKTLQCFYDQFINLTTLLDYEKAKNLIAETSQLSNNNGQDLFLPLRLAITGVEHGPELYKIITLFEKNIILERIKKILNYEK